MTFLSQLHWRHATKTFDPEKSISKEDLQKIKDAILLAPTSYGLQPFKVHIITDQEIKNNIQAVAWNQPQVGTCSHLLVFCADPRVEDHIENYLTLASGDTPEGREALKGYEGMLNSFAESTDEAARWAWAKNQVYLAQGFALAACAELNLDSCPMEGFSSEDLDKILELPEYLKSTLLLPIGYRASDPREKVRKSEEEVFL